MKAKILLEKQNGTSQGAPLIDGATVTSAGLRGEIDNAAPRPPLKWAGGKRWLVPHLVPIWRVNQQRRFVEPFCGGIAVALGLQPGKALLNDVNSHLINFYHHLQSGVEVTIQMKNDEKCFYRNRSRFNKLVASGEAKSAEAAQLFYYLNRTGFNGLCRFNRSGEFNVPFGTHKSITYLTDFAALQSTLKNWRFTNLDVGSIKLKAQDFIYADPPYDVEFTTYSAGGFSWDDQVRTAEWLAAHSGPVVLSNQATKRIVTLYKRLGFKISYLDGPRRISCTGDRTSAPEVLAVRNLA